MDVFSEIMKPVVQVLMVPAKKELGYLISCATHVKDMRRKMTELEVAKCGEEEHLNRNTENRLEISSQVREWLEKVKNINAKVETFPSEVGSCFNIMDRHKLGRKAFQILEEIESVTRQHSLITWSDRPIPLGRVDSARASTSAPSTTNHHEDFQSRNQTFLEALKAFQPNHKSHMIALCGMGGVGKTTMMEKLKKVVEKKKMFNYIVEVVIGENKDPIAAIQEVVATYIGVELIEKDKRARANKLCQGFKAKSDGGKNRFLIILDDIWHFVDLEDIGLSPLPNQGVDFKVLLTSRDKDVCTKMGVEADLVLSVGLLIEEEAQSLFNEFVQTSDPELLEIGEDIVRKCCGLPIAIKTMGCTLRGKDKDTWRDALARLGNHDIKTIAGAVFETSYNNLHDDETEATFLLCGMYSEDFNIPMEDLVRYGWGLKIFKGVYTIRNTRYRLRTCIERLMHTNLLIKSDDIRCVKLHDLVRAFILDMFSKSEHASFVNHDRVYPGWPENYMGAASCRRLSLTCNGISEFRRDLKFPNLSVLKLMHGGASLSFPRDFYEEMAMLQVIAYDQMKHPLLPSSLQCSFNLRVLLLHECKLMSDFSPVGNLLNLEILSFANSGVKWLPIVIGNLKQLRLLDVTGSHGLRIDNGVLKNLVKLEELYLTIDLNRFEKVVHFTKDNYNEMELCFKNLFALEVEFQDDNVQLKNMSFEKLERFKISFGCVLFEDLRDIKLSLPFPNTLYLVTGKGNLLDSGLNKLFEKTEVLYLSVDYMNYLKDIEFINPSRPPRFSPFYNLRVLLVTKCTQLRYLLTLGVAKALSKLEHLHVGECNNMKEIICIESGKEETISFPELTSLYLGDLPKLSGLCDNVNMIKLPQLVELDLIEIPNVTSIFSMHKLERSCVFKGEVVIPKLEKLSIENMDNLNKIWPYEFGTREEVPLREIKVRNCDKLVNVFPSNPMPLLHHLEELHVNGCDAIEVLFNIDLDCVGEIGLEEGSTSRLKIIQLANLPKLREVWRIKGVRNSFLPFRVFQAVEQITIGTCERFRNLFTPITTNFDLGALMEMEITIYRESGSNNESVGSSQEKEITILSNKETSQVSVVDNISKVIFGSHGMHTFHNLRKLEFRICKGLDVVFEIEGPRSRELVAGKHNQQIVLPYLESLDLRCIETMTHVWKYKWNKFFILDQEQLSEFSFHNLTTINMEYCHNIKYLFSPHLAHVLSNLKKVEIRYCKGIEEVVSNRDDEVQDDEKTTSTHTRTTLFPHLDSMFLHNLNNLKCIGGGNNEISFKNTTKTNSFLDQSQVSQVGGVSWTMSQYCRNISIYECHGLSNMIPYYALGQMQKLQRLVIDSCYDMKEVFETQGIKNDNKINDVNGGTLEIPRPNDVILLKLSNLKVLRISSCHSLEYIFTFSALESLKQLEELQIYGCRRMKVIVKEENDGDQTTSSSSKVMVFPCLKSIELVDLSNLVSFFMGMNEFLWPLLDKVTISRCPHLTSFTHGESTTPKLKYIHTHLGKHILEPVGLNFLLKTTSYLQPPIFERVDHTSLFPVPAKRMPWSFHNLIELYMTNNIEPIKIIPRSALLQLQKLEQICVIRCNDVDEVFEPLGWRYYMGFDRKSQTTVVNLPNLRQVKLERLAGLRYIWKSSQDTIFEFPNLIRVSIVVCPKLEHVITSAMVCSLLQLQELNVEICDLVEEVFEALKGTHSTGSDELQSTVVKLPNLRQVKLVWLQSLRYLWKSNQWTVFEFPNLTRLEIIGCKSLQHVFTCYMAGSLLQLQELHISKCDKIEAVIVKDANGAVEEEEEADAKMNEIMLPRLKSLILKKLACFKGLCLENVDFSFPLLDTLKMKRCPTIKIFTKGSSATPELKVIKTGFGSFFAGDINSFIELKQEEFKLDAESDD